ncbi:MAG: helix-turn-helix transcriptional regulator [Bacilli bacterium]|nr:helix-turn-helix transcriptional regulator [Bacilli bacterium]
MELNKNIYNLRKAKGFSQEYMAEQINVSRQTISNWELGETSPNPEQLLLLSKTLETSVDNLLGNEMSFKDSNDKYNYIYLGSMIVCGSIAGIWAFTANRFKLSEMALIIIGGVAIGYGIGLVVNGVLKKLEWKNSTTKEDNRKTLKKTR